MKTPETRGGILVVDDEENIRSLLKLTLEGAGVRRQRLRHNLIMDTLAR